MPLVLISWLIGDFNLFIVHRKRWLKKSIDHDRCFNTIVISTCDFARKIDVIPVYNRPTLIRIAMRTCLQRRIIGTALPSVEQKMLST